MPPNPPNPAAFAAHGAIAAHIANSAKAATRFNEFNESLAFSRLTTMQRGSYSTVKNFSDFQDIAV